MTKGTRVKTVKAVTTLAARHPVKTGASALNSTTTTTSAHVQKVIKSNSVITKSSGPTIFVRYNRVNLCVYYYNQFVQKSLRYDRVLL